MIEAARAVGAGQLERFAHGTTIATNAPSNARARGRRSSPLRGSSTCCTCGGRRGRICTDDHPGVACSARAMSRRRRANRPEGVLTEVDIETVPDVEAEAVAVCFPFSFRDPTERLVADEPAPPPPGCARRRVARVCAGVSRVRACLDDRPRRLPWARHGAVPASARDDAVRRGRSSRAASCARRAVRRRSPKRPHIPPGRSSPVRPPAWSARPWWPVRRASRTQSPSTWAGRRPTSA